MIAINYRPISVLPAYSKIFEKDYIFQVQYQLTLKVVPNQLRWFTMINHNQTRALLTFLMLTEFKLYKKMLYEEE